MGGAAPEGLSAPLPSSTPSLFPRLGWVILDGSSHLEVKNEVRQCSYGYWVSLPLISSPLLKSSPDTDRA